MKDSFYSHEEIGKLGFKTVGEAVKISRKASIYDAGNISIGSYVRIDDFCIISGKMEIGNYVHISAFTGIFAGDKGIYINDFCTISGRCNIYGKTDDYSGTCMTNPMVPTNFKNIIDECVIFEKHSIIGCGSTVLPGCFISEGTAVGCMSLIKTHTEPWKIYAGIPAKFIGERQRNPLILEKEII